MRILLIGKRHYTNMDALAERFGRVYRLPMHWHRMGHDVALHLLDYRGRHPLDTNPDGFTACSWPVRSPRALLAFRRAVTAFRPQVLVAAGDSLVGLVGRKLARDTGAGFVFDAYDDYRRFGSSRILLGWNAFDWLRRNADATFYASQRLAAGHPGERPRVLVPNAVAPEDFAGLDQEACRRVAGFPEQARIVGYFGSMEADRGVAVLIRAVSQMRAAGIEVILLLAGKRDPGTPLPDRDDPGVRYLGLVPHNQVPGLMAACDVLALPYLRSEIMDMGVSCKIGEYLYSRRPLAATRTPNFEANFPEQAQALAGRLALPGDADDLASVIARQLDDPLVAPLPGHVSWEAVASESAAMLASVARES